MLSRLRACLGLIFKHRDCLVLTEEVGKVVCRSERSQSHDGCKHGSGREFHDESMDEGVFEGGRLGKCETTSS